VLAEEGDDLITTGAIQRSGGFIGKQNSGGVGEGAQHGDALPFALGELGDGVLPVGREAELLSEVSGASVNVNQIGGWAAHELGGEKSVFCDGEVVEQSEVLKDETEVMEAEALAGCWGLLVEGGGIGVTDGTGLWCK
jgi:hypothetical protein